VNLYSAYRFLSLRWLCHQWGPG